MNNYIDIVFDGPPAHESGRFIEVENFKGESISIGEWIDRSDLPDGWCVLRIETATSGKILTDTQQEEK